MSDHLSIALEQLVPQQCFDEAARKMKETAEGQEGGIVQRAMTGLAASRLRAALASKFNEIDLLPLFVKGWGKAPAIEQAARESEQTANPRFVRLGKLEQNMDLYPILSVSGWGLTSGPIPFTLTLQAEFEAVEVGLTKGHVVELAGGFCRISALLKFGQFSFPAGIAPIEWKIGTGRKFEKPGVPLLAQAKAKPRKAKPKG